MPFSLQPDNHESPYTQEVRFMVRFVMDVSTAMDLNLFHNELTKFLEDKVAEHINEMLGVKSFINADAYDMEEEASFYENEFNAWNPPEDT